MEITGKQLSVAVLVATVIHSAAFGFSPWGFSSELPEKTYTIHLAPLGENARQFSGEHNEQRKRQKGNQQKHGDEQSQAESQDSENRDGQQKDDTAPGPVDTNNQVNYEA